MSTLIHPICVPKWGLSMEEGKVTDWLVETGDTIAEGDEILEIETSKITNVVEAHINGTLRRIIAEPGDTLPVGAILGVVTDKTVTEEEIDAFIADFVENFSKQATQVHTEENQVQTAAVGALDISYSRIEGTEPPVIFIHGYGGDSGNWLFNIDAADGRTVYVLDLPGHGLSSKTLDNGSLEELAGVITGFMDTLDIETAHLVGHSLGAMIAGQIAEEASGRIASLTMVAPGGLSSSINDTFLSTFASANSRGEMKNAMQYLFSDKSLLTRDLLNETLKSLRIDGVREGLEKIRAACFGGGKPVRRFDDLIANTNIPLLLVFGETDEIVLSPESAKGTVLTGTGHMPHMENAQAFNKLLKEHLGKSETGI